MHTPSSVSRVVPAWLEPSGATHDKTVGDALVAILRDSFDTQTREAWHIAYNLVAETMLDGAASARPIRT
jgi:hypothetical protein